MTAQAQGVLSCTCIHSHISCFTPLAAGSLLIPPSLYHLPQSFVLGIARHAVIEFMHEFCYRIHCAYQRTTSCSTAATNCPKEQQGLAGRLPEVSGIQGQERQTEVGLYLSVRRHSSALALDWYFAAAFLLLATASG